ncbi:TPA: isoleucine--tRNA ligase [Candidatus Uhrbacteria bacterium]|nr:isoleucine--tRNA ligase [Candidatus Uhrbacteria bacterium]
MAERKGADAREQDVLEYWKKNRIFERSVEERPEENQFIFYDGPPFATGTPHYGHLVGGTMKDVVPRYWTMRGKRVERVWGWDCHGLPIENLIEKDLDLGSRDKIRAFGIDQFNESCRARVLEYVDEWERVVPRMGRWVDMEHCYRTMDPQFMESVWWGFKQLWEKNALYEGYRPIHICPRCATTLSSSEAGSNYSDITDTSVTVRFKVNGEADTFILAWTTTPWTLPGNMLLAVGASVPYVKVKQRHEFLILAKDRLESVMDGEYEVIEELTAADLIGKTYEPLFPYFADRPGAFRVVAADFVTTDEGTGVVHIAPGFGEDDFYVGQAEQLDIIRHVNIDGTFTAEVKDFAGEQAKPSDHKILEHLAGRGLVYMTKPLRHSYPLCWRCDTPLLNYTTNSWYVRVADIRDRLLANNKQTTWVPSNMKDGRFGNWLEGARDWAVSRQRYWGTPLPIWRAEDGEMLVIGSIKELETLSGKKVTDLHKHLVDEIVIEKEGKTFTRIPEVLDCWFESGSMPYARLHYPFENQEKFEAGLPADFIAEGQDQTRAWFYYLMVMSTWLFDKPAFTNVIVNGIVVAEDGKKMSKRLKNYPDPMEVVERYGADALRMYLMSSPVVNAENLRFKESGVKEVSNKFVGTLNNVLSFYQLFVHAIPEIVQPEELHPLDRWILAQLQQTRVRVTSYMDAYELAPAARELQDFVTELSQWYVRRSRDRFKDEASDDYRVASRVLYRVLEMLSRMIAPFAPFLAEHVYRSIADRPEEDSVHLALWPMDDDLDFMDEEILGIMKTVRDLVTRVLDQRTEAKIPVRQILHSAVVRSSEALPEACLEIIRDEVNVESITWEEGELGVTLDTVLTPELKQAGIVRELQRQGNSLRKDAGLQRDDVITLYWESDNKDVIATFETFEQEIATRVNAKEIVRGLANAKQTTEVKIGEGVTLIGL